MGFLNIFGKKKSVGEIGLGIDIGTISVKVAEVTRTAGGLSMTNYAIAELADRSDALNNALQSSSLHPLTEDLRLYLTEIRKRTGFKTLTANLSLPCFLSQTALIDVPATSSEKTIASAVFKTAGAYLPLPLTETTLRWVDVGEVTYPDGTKHRKVLFMAIPSERVAEYTEIATRAGFTVADIELENVSAARALTMGNQEPSLIIDIGGRSSTCTVAARGVCYAVAQTDFSSDSATQAVARALSISPKRAEALKRQSTINYGAGGHELSTIVTPILGVILNEAGRARKIFEDATGQLVKQVIICGAGSQLTGLEQYITNDFKLPVLRANTIGTTVNYPPELNELLPELNANLTVALGLAIKNL